MTFDEYQETASRTRQPWAPIVYPAIGVAGEAGEVANCVKKMLRDDRGVLMDERRDKLAMELGDVLWYVAALAADLGLKLSDIAARNLDKTQSRQRRGTINGEGDDR